MNPDTYTFSGDAITFLGLVGVLSTGIILFTAFRRFFRSPYNVSVRANSQTVSSPAPESES